ncbi:monovalent cation:H+ antiporter-2, CPA2 family [Catalinimonas alkaloidigena]|uniref:Monovalent cation:H+ antiporter-2, CPA2 family n=1 Tax=Catalinimonas alkaloidigena TaxID=1075417 RepID=A0A1G9PQ76_9BACT|nr:cation:proton antiporter [Catalinimonas alkaloidigena]SDM00874.1 monovalent cation:H+ antiporter-2, CPA2 family [Catalinimonas alkaloidigena]
MAHVPPLILDLALILGVAGITTLIFKKLNQPLVLGYLLAGLLVGPNFPLFPTILETESIRTWADIGVIFLLFGLGLEFSFKKLVQVGGAASLTGLLEIGAMLLLGYSTGTWLGWSAMDSLFLGGIMAISSTTIILRAFEELGLKTRRFVSLVFGILIIEDLVAILLLVLLSTLAISQRFAGMELLGSLLKLGFFLTVWFLAGIFLIPSLLRRLRQTLTDETLLILSLGLCFVMVVLVTSAGFSSALGAFLMGSILAETIFVEKIEHLLRPIKDLFGAVFFVSVGMLINPVLLLDYLGPVLLISATVILGKAFFVSLGAVLAGQSLRHALATGMSMTQIGEFSFIIATLGVSLRVTSDFLYPIAVAVSVLTTFTTPYLMRLAEPFYRVLERQLPSRWRASLQTYSAGTQRITQVSDWQQVLRTYLQAVTINTVICIALILLTTYFLTPIVTFRIIASPWGEMLTALLALSLMAPFLWALSVKKLRSTSYVTLWRSRVFSRGPLVALEAARIAIGVGLVSFLLAQLFSVLVGLGAAVLMIGVVLPLFTHRLQQTYARLENRFLYNLNARALEQQRPMAYRHLVPWDAHLASFEVSPDADCLGKTLTELAFREKYGVNIVQIERGSRTIVAPNGAEPLFPGDKLTVVGTDEQLQRFKPTVAPTPAQVVHTTPEVMLKQLMVDAQFPFLGKSIREARIREKTHGLVVGIERGGQRMLNPDPATVFQLGDVVWISGEKQLILSLEHENESPSA